MTGIQCPHCGQVHPPVSRFCPATGRPLAAQPAPGHAFSPAPGPGPVQGPRADAYGAAPPAAPAYGALPPGGAGAPAYGAAPPAAPGPVGPPAPTGAGDRSSSARPKPIGTILTEAFELYQKNLVALVTTCAILVAPVALAEAGMTALLLAPTVAVTATADHNARLSQAAAERLQRDLVEAQRDPAKARELQRDEQQHLQDLSRSVAATGAAAVGGLLSILLSFAVSMLSIAMLYAIAVPLTTAALTILVADRATGGKLGPGAAYKRMLSRLPALLSATIPAFFLVLLGLCFLLIPGVILGLLFVFVTPVVMLERHGGISALKRSASLVKANVLQVLVVGLVFGVIRVVTTIVAHMVVPVTALFAASLVQNFILLFLLPIPIVGSVLLYLDIRRQTEGLDDRGVRRALAE
jgi:hypothetical protein